MAELRFSFDHRLHHDDSLEAMFDLLDYFDDTGFFDSIEWDEQTEAARVSNTDMEVELRLETEIIHIHANLMAYDLSAPMMERNLREDLTRFFGQASSSRPASQQSLSRANKFGVKRRRGQSTAPPPPAAAATPTPPFRHSQPSAAPPVPFQQAQPAAPSTPVQPTAPARPPAPQRPPATLTSSAPSTPPPAPVPTPAPSRKKTSGFVIEGLGSPTTAPAPTPQTTPPSSFTFTPPPATQTPAAPARPPASTPAPAAAPSSIPQRPPAPTRPPAPQRPPAPTSARPSAPARSVQVQPPAPTTGERRQPFQVSMSSSASSAPVQAQSSVPRQRFQTGGGKSPVNRNQAAENSSVALTSHFEVGPRSSQPPLRVLQAYGEGFSLAAKNFGVLVMGLIVTTLINTLLSITVIGALFIPSITLGWYKLCLQVTREEEATVGTVFSGFSAGIKPLLASFLTGLLIFVGLLFFIIPGYILALMHFPLYYVMADHPELGVLDSMAKARSLSKGYLLPILGLNFLLPFVVALGMLFFGIGTLFTVPVAMLAMTLYYDRTLCQE